MKTKQYIIDRLKEPSTWRGLVLIATALGAKITPDQSEAVIMVGISIAGLIGVVTEG
ncbi:hypothetical protein [Desulforegula conservatrix]|uniref:hypothetical protein n=1 Tax=Desulforegula conservatrix TaxID=153026 RepID=UPI0003FFA7FC|nr:hypothetical protein [Desulforegula conservatrix]